jgi:2-oxoglutarate ferredoxin oxidoreductase subunit alpha
MQELLSSAIMMELPLVIVDVQRVGPGLGSATMPSQGDMMQARWGPHGGIPSIALVPNSVEETYYLTVRAFNLSEKFRVPVFLMTDATVGHMREKLTFPNPDELEIVERRRPTGPPEKYRLYEPDETGIPLLADVGSGYRVHHNSSVHDFYGHRANSIQVIDLLIRRLANKLVPYYDEIVQTEGKFLDDAEIAVFAYGVVARAAEAAALAARQQGIKAGVLRPITAWPFPDKAVYEVAKQVHTIIVAEMNMGQLYYEVQRASCGQTKVELLSRVDSLTISPQQILDRIKEAA